LFIAKLFIPDQSFTLSRLIHPRMTQATGASPPPEPPHAEDLNGLRLWRRLHIRLTVLYGGLTLLSIILLGVGTYRSAVQRELGAIRQLLAATSNGLAASIDAQAVATLPAEPRQPAALHRLLLTRFGEVARQEPDVQSIYLLRPTQEPTRLRFVVDYVRQGPAGQPGQLYDASDVPLMLKGFRQHVVEEFPVRDSFGRSLSAYAPVKTPQGKQVAVLGVDMDASRIDQIQEDVLRDVALSFGITTLLLGALAALVGWNLRAPLERIMAATTAISSGELDTRIGMRRGDELGLMSRHIDRMAAQLQERELIRDLFGRFLSTRIASELLRQGEKLSLGGEERVVTALFMDLWDYTTISEQLSPPQVVDILNTYLEAMNEVLERHQGSVIEFKADGIFAVFGAPYSLSQHAVVAVRCAMAMQAALHDLNRTWQENGSAKLWQRSGVASLRGRVGIHYGAVVVGNLGSKRHMKYSVIGDTVNIASRLESLNKELQTEILISQEVFVQLPDDLANRATAQGRHQVKGRDELVRVYAVSWHSDGPSSSPP
jgi:adenylate cyclase